MQEIIPQGIPKRTSLRYNRCCMENLDSSNKQESVRSTISGQGWGVGLALFIAQKLPHWLGYPLARAMGFLMGAFRSSGTYRSVRLNQWMIHGKRLQGRDLERTVRRVFANQSIALYDYYRALAHPEIAREKVQFSPAFSHLVEECKQEQRGTLLLIAHLAGFNLGGLRLVQEGMPYLTLANTDTSPAYQWQNELRSRFGMEVMPFTFQALSKARARLQAGGTVLTGVDRPMENAPLGPRFFNYPSALPVAYIRLALKTNARVFVVGFTSLSDHSHWIDVSEEIHLEKDDSPQGLARNAERVLAEVEAFIRRDPFNWMMFFPVWPQEIAELEGKTK